MKKIVKLLFILTIVFQFVFMANFALAEVVTGADCNANPTGAGCNTDVPAAGPNDLKNPLGDTDSVPKLIGNVINAALGIVGSLALIMFIYGGFTWMLAAGNEKGVEKGKNILMWATIGLVVIFASYSLVDFIINTGIHAGAK